MTFEEALKELRNGKTLTRAGWKVAWSKIQQCVWVEKNKYLQMMFSGMITWEDMNSDDWELNKWQARKVLDDIKES